MRNILDWNGEENPRDGNEDNKAACLRKKTALLKRLRDTEENLFESFVPVITYNLDSKTSGQQILNDLVGIKEKAATDLDRIDSILSAAQESSKNIGLSEYATIFRDEAKRHEMFGNIWLGTSVFLFLVVAAFTVAALCYSIEHKTELQTLKEMWPIYIPFFFLFSLLTSASIWSVRVYRGHRHNFIVNEHRYNALRTFRVFAESVKEDEQTKNAVLLQATQCIFSPQDTGHSGTGRLPLPQTQLIELIKGATRSSPNP